MRVRNLALLLLMFLLVMPMFFPYAYGTEYYEISYVNALDDNWLEWVEVGSDPYIDDSDGSYIYTKTDGADHGSFTTPDYTNGTFVQVWLYVEMKCDVSTRNDEAEIRINDGNDVEVYQQDVDATVYTWYSFNASSGDGIHTWTEFNNALFWFTYDRIGSPTTEYIYVRRAYMNVTYDYAVTGTTYSRTLSASFSLSATLDPEGSYSRTQSEGFSLAESLLSHQEVSRTQSEAFTLTESQAQKKGLSRVQQESFSLAEVLSEAQSLSRTEQEAFNLADTLDPKRSYSRTQTEGFSLADSLSRHKTANRVLQETFLITETLDPSQSLSRTQSESFSLADSLTSKKGLLRTIQETFSISDSILEKQTLSRTESEGVSYTDSLGRKVSYSRTETEGFSLAGVLSDKLTVVRVNSESFSVSITVSRKASYSRVQTELMNFLESLISVGPEPTPTSSITIISSPEVNLKFTHNGTQYYTSQGFTWNQSSTQTLVTNYTLNPGWTFQYWASPSIGTDSGETLTYTVPDYDETIIIYIEGEGGVIPEAPRPERITLSLRSLEGRVKVEAGGEACLMYEITYTGKSDLIFDRFALDSLYYRWGGSLCEKRELIQGNPEIIRKDSVRWDKTYFEDTFEIGLYVKPPVEASGNHNILVTLELHDPNGAQFSASDRAKLNVEQVPEVNYSSLYIALAGASVIGAIILLSNRKPKYHIRP